MNDKNICMACGTGFPDGQPTPALCPICDDDRQAVPEHGQRWISHTGLSASHSVNVKKINDSLYELKIVPSFAIGQRALLVLSPGGNILWDCIALLDEPAIAFIKSKGGLKAIVFSHPHYYSTMNEWANTFDCPIYIHEKDEPWIFNKGGRVSLWPGAAKDLWDGIRIIHLGGHFPGSSILQVPFLSSGGTVLCGDTLTISPNKRHISVMFSYPNRIPLPLAEMQRIHKQVLPLPFDSMHGYAESQDIYSGAKEILARSFARYI